MYILSLRLSYYDFIIVLIILNPVWPLLSINVTLNINTTHKFYIQTRDVDSETD
jgi:hypothetical protein